MAEITKIFLNYKRHTRGTGVLAESKFMLLLDFVQKQATRDDKTLLTTLQRIDQPSELRGLAEQTFQKITRSQP